MSASERSADKNNQNIHFSLRVILKALVIFLVINLVFATFYPLPALGKLSIYNNIVPGRKRLPYADNPSRSYNISLFNLDAMFASHEISAGNKPKDEFRVVLIGDSSTWGYLLPVDQTLSASLNQADLKLPDGRTVRSYNLGYPVMSLTKDLLLLSRAIHYDPDMIVWLVTLESFPYDKQLSPPLLQHNPGSLRELIQKYNLRVDENSEHPIENSFWQRTIIGSRRNIADWLRLQLFGILWSATGIDQEIPATFPTRIEDLSEDTGFHELTPPNLDKEDLAVDVLKAGVDLAASIPVIIVNEPMFISSGENSHIRYNFYYPRWAYDDYRQYMDEFSTENDWHYLDLWDAISPAEFTNTAIHLTPDGTDLLAGRIGTAILGIAGGQP